MGLRDALDRLLSADGTGSSSASDPAGGAARTVIYECRHCGTAVTADAERCPTCGAGEIAEYAIP